MTKEKSVQLASTSLLPRSCKSSFKPTEAVAVTVANTILCTVSTLVFVSVVVDRSTILVTLFVSVRVFVQLVMVVVTAFSLPPPPPPGLRLNKVCKERIGEAGAEG